jgi:S-DNA-T family DNA segregation ATPase FtsK/SpoIIIE
MATLLARQGVPIAVVSPKTSALADVSVAAQVLVGADARTIGRDWLVASGAQVLFVDDAELLDADDPTHAELFSGRVGVRVVAGMALQHLRDTMRGWPAALKRGRTGLLLSPRSTFEGDVFGIHRLPDALVFDGPAGRAVAGVDGRLDVVQVPFV